MLELTTKENLLTFIIILIAVAGSLVKSLDPPLLIKPTRSDAGMVCVFESATSNHSFFTLQTNDYQYNA